MAAVVDDGGSGGRWRRWRCNCGMVAVDGGISGGGVWYW